MINFDDYTNENKTEHKLVIYSRSSIQNTFYRRFWIRKNKCVIEFNKKSPRDKIFLYAKDPYEAKYQYLIKICEKAGLNHFDDPKAFMEYSDDMQYAYKNIEEYNPGKNVKY